MSLDNCVIRGESAEGKTFESKAACFPKINGIVRGEFKYNNKMYSFELPVYKGVYIHDAYRGREGKLGYSIRGVTQEYLVTGIWKDAKGQGEENRAITVCYLNQINEAIKNKDTYIQTVFGFKFIDYPKDSKSEGPGATIDLPLEYLGKEI